MATFVRVRNDKINNRDAESTNNSWIFSDDQYDQFINKGEAEMATINEQFWDAGRNRWDGHRTFNTVNHHHISCYSPVEGRDSCDLMIVECADGRWYVEDNWGGDAQGAEKVWNPFDRNATEPHFFSNQGEAHAHAVALVARICGVPESAVSYI
jgi:hypothetical protein